MTNETETAGGYALIYEPRTATAALFFMLYFNTAPSMREDSGTRFVFRGSYAEAEAAALALVSQGCKAFSRIAADGERAEVARWEDEEDAGGFPPGASPVFFRVARLSLANLLTSPGFNT